MSRTKIIKLFFFLVMLCYITAAPLDDFPSSGAAGATVTAAHTAKELRRLKTEVRILTRELLDCKSKNKLSLSRRFFNNKEITCSDGTTAGYYIRRSYESKKWIIYLQGGWYCFNDPSCIARMSAPSMKGLMSSSLWSLKQQGSGILSSNPKENPTWWNANHVFVPYCSSDAWSGNVSRSESGGKFSFMGYRIINQLIKELLPQGLLKSDHLLFAGSSAGGIGVIMNVDRVAAMMRAAGSSSEVRGLADSGWYLERKPDLSKCRNSPNSCVKPSDVIANGMRYWRGVAPKKCAVEFHGEPWRCYFGHNVYRTLKSPLFIFQWQYDQTQMVVENPAAGLSRDTTLGVNLTKVFKLAQDMRQSLHSSKIRAVFAPACLSHSVLTDSKWLSVKVRGYNLDRALNCWFVKDSQKNSTLSPNLLSTHCNSTLIDGCQYPQCSEGCPIPIDHFTGKRIVAPKTPGKGYSINLKSWPSIRLPKHTGP